MKNAWKGNRVHVLQICGVSLHAGTGPALEKRGTIEAANDRVGLRLYTCTHIALQTQSYTHLRPATGSQAQ